MSRRRGRSNLVEPAVVDGDTVGERSVEQTDDEGGWREYLKSVGPGLVTGASDDDPSGIATYSQAGAQFKYSMLWVIGVDGTDRPGACLTV
jgi:hypothetical protein